VWVIAFWGYVIEQKVVHKLIRQGF